MTPLWIWALGRYFYGHASTQIPVTNVFASLAVVTVPVGIGLLVGHFKPQRAAQIAWCLKPFTGLIGAVFIVLGTYVYWYALVRVTWRTLLACTVVPFVGYCIGAGAGKLFRQEKRQWITIALETGFQNLALSMLILETSLSPPDSDLAGVVPICYSFLSAALPSTVFLLRFAVRLHRRGCKCDKKAASSDNEASSTSTSGDADEELQRRLLTVSGYTRLEQDSSRDDEDDDLAVDTVNPENNLSGSRDPDTANPQNASAVIV